ncbi:MAG: 4Fe-4S binding protein [Defluviitaleaceae bacterium]|nr:4Fe-4S binding protein [Defluviitaleaceae bacterium]
MTRDEIAKNAEQFMEDYSGIKIYDTPVFAFGHAADALYEEYKSPDVIGGHFLTPLEWLPDSKTVISFFLPYTERIKSANGRDYLWPADEWLHGRFEGHKLLLDISSYIQQLLSEAGYESLVPALDARYNLSGADTKFTSNWSERHIAFACGLGTFGLSKGLITEKGMCGRFGSILTKLDLPKDTRPYKDIYEYCTMCGACIPHCPVQAISPAGKEHLPCSDFLDKVREKSNPRYGCGKCQVNVPCESGIPKLKKV